MSPAALSKVSKLLLKRLAELTGQAESIGDFRTETGGDACDMAFNTTESEISLQLAQHSSQEINLIKVALDKITKGQYGLCDGCDCKIMAARLEALPYSLYCIKCQAVADRGGQFEGRPTRSYDAMKNVPYSTEDADSDLSKNLEDLE